MEAETSTGSRATPKKSNLPTQSLLIMKIQLQLDVGELQMVLSLAAAGLTQRECQAQKTFLWLFSSFLSVLRSTATKYRCSVLMPGSFNFSESQFLLGLFFGYVRQKFGTQVESSRKKV